jgi:hypothetical protein
VKLFGPIGTVPLVIVSILSLPVAGLLALALWALVTGEGGAALGLLIFAFVVATPTTIIYLVARILHKPAIPAIPPPPPPLPPGFVPQPYPLPEQQLANPHELR